MGPLTIWFFKEFLLKEQLRLLLELQTIDTRVRDIRAAMVALPASIEPAKADLARLEAMLETEKKKLQETELFRREQELLIKTEQQAISAAKTKLQASKNTKDFAAASREVDHKRRAMSDREDEVLKIIEAIEKSKADLASHETDVAALREQVEAKSAEINTTVTALEQEAATVSAGLAEMRSKIDTKTLARYDLSMKKRGSGLAEVINGTCRGCHMSLPAQLNNILARGDTLETCPRCQRLVYRPDALAVDGEAEVAADAGTPAPPATTEPPVADSAS